MASFFSRSHSTKHLEEIVEHVGFVEIGRRRLAPVPSDQDWERLKDEEGRLNDALLDWLDGVEVG